MSIHKNLATWLSYASAAFLPQNPPMSLLLFAIAATAAKVALAAPADIFDEATHLSPRATPLQFEIVGNSGVSAQQMFLGTANKVRALNIFFGGLAASCSPFGAS